MKRDNSATALRDEPATGKCWLHFDAVFERSSRAPQKPSTMQDSGFVYACMVSRPSFMAQWSILHIACCAVHGTWHVLQPSN